MDKTKTVAPGIRKKPDGTFLVTKSIKGERHYFTTNNLAKAKQWKQLFVPFVNPNAKAEVINPAATSKMNGRDLEMTFGKAWKKYQQDHLSTLGEETQYRVGLRVERFAASLMNVRMCEINAETIEAVIQERKTLSKIETRGYLRCNFDKELKFLRQIFDWYSGSEDPYFESPIENFHKRVGKIKAVPEINRHIKPHEVQIFVAALDGIWKKLACMQFYMAGRVQEPAGLQKPYIEKERRRIRVECVMTWVRGKPAPKYSTKTDVVTYVTINDHMMEMIEELEAECPPGCPYLFQVDGKPLRYNWIIGAYNEALKKTGLPYTGTHILRYGMAGYAGQLLGDEGSKAATRHGSMAMARKYRGKSKVVELTEENRQVVIHAESLFRASSCDQDNVSECI